MGNYKWVNNDSIKEKESKVIFFVSRNKDNQNINNFKERRESYFRHFNEEKMKVKFKDFVNHGVDGEFCRMYVSNNSRNTNKVHKELLKLLIDKDDLNLDYIESTVAGLAAKKECAAEQKWFFDFDCNDEIQVEKFTEDIKKIDSSLTPTSFRTPHGFAIVVEHGFDTRTLLEKWSGFATLKRDDLICVDWEIKGGK